MHEKRFRYPLFVDSLKWTLYFLYIKINKLAKIMMKPHRLTQFGTGSLAYPLGKKIGRRGLQYISSTA